MSETFDAIIIGAGEAGAVGRRALNRTEEMPAGALWIDEAAFDLFKGRFEPLGEDEEHIRITTDA